MSKNTISTFQLFEMFPDQEAGRKYLEDRRWCGKVTCPHCDEPFRRGLARQIALSVQEHGC